MNITKAIIFDAGTLISLSMSGLLDELRELKQHFNGAFVITLQVKQEVVDKPLTIKKFELDAMRVQALLEEKILVVPKDLGIDERQIEEQTNHYLAQANTIFYARGKDIRVIHNGEASCLAISKILRDQGVKNVIAIDERSTRQLCENPEKLRERLAKKLHTRVTAKEGQFAQFRDFSFIRSPELMYVAFKKGLVDFPHSDKAEVLDAMLFALKFKGAAISGDEIKAMVRMSKK